MDSKPTDSSRKNRDIVVPDVVDDATTLKPGSTTGRENQPKRQMNLCNRRDKTPLCQITMTSSDGSINRRSAGGSGCVELSAYLERKGLDVVLAHAADLIDKRLAPAYPDNDGRQTPMRNHPVFIAQHATATCCRGCLEKWHAITKGHELPPEEKQYVIDVIRHWLERERQE